MTKVIYLDSMLYDMMDAKELIRAYFVSKDSPELIAKHLKQFQDDLERKVELLKDNPALYAIRKGGAFKNANEEFRPFPVHWFMVFYTYYGNTVDLWHVRSQRSDYRKLFRR